MPEIVTKEISRSTTSREDGRADSNLPALRVRYYRQMKHRRVYTVEVFWQKAARPPVGDGKEVTVRLLAPGAQVVPGEQTLNAAKPDVRAFFYVTPLAKGWLPNQKVEVLAQGRKIQEIPMASKVVSQRLTWLLLLLGVLVPWFLVEHVKNSSLGEPIRVSNERIVYPKISKEVEDYIKGNVPAVPNFLKGTQVATGLLETRSGFATAYEQVVLVSRIEPLAFYAGAVLLTLALISAFLHKQKRRTTRGKPLQVTAVGTPVETRSIDGA